MLSDNFLFQLICHLDAEPLWGISAVSKGSNTSSGILETNKEVTKIPFTLMQRTAKLSYCQFKWGWVGAAILPRLSALSKKPLNWGGGEHQQEKIHLLSKIVALTLNNCNQIKLMPCLARQSIITVIHTQRHTDYRLQSLHNTGSSVHTLQPSNISQICAYLWYYSSPHTKGHCPSCPTPTILYC